MLLIQVYNPVAQLVNDLANAGYYTHKQAALTVDYYLKKGHTLDLIRKEYRI